MLAKSNERVAPNRVAAPLIQIGKDVIELITSGMYVSPITIFREYVQNSADALDAARAQNVLAPGQGRVSIALDHTKRTITVRDNGTGIPVGKAPSILLAIGASPKRGSEARGFRGIGRLSGLAYCRELQFRTKAFGENDITSIRWDCRALRALLIERNSQDLQALIEAVVTVDIEQSDDSSDHFFEVTMRDVSRHRYDILLNEKMIAEYLSQVAPVPFHPSFSFAPEIERHISDCGANITAVDLYIDDQQIFRPYRNEIGLPASDKSLRVQGIELLDFRDVDGGLAAVGWIGHHEYVRSIPSSLNIRGIRGRIGNVQIGDFDLFQDCYKEPRFNGWSIGELHIVDRRILPNARRDNLELNHHHYNLLAQMGPLAASISTKCRTSSVSRNAVIGIQNAIEGARRVLDGKPTIDAGLASSSMASLARVRLRLKGVGDETKRQGLQSEITKLEGELRAIDYNTPTRIVAFDEVIALVSKLVTNRDQAKKLKEALQNITA